MSRGPESKIVAAIVARLKALKRAGAPIWWAKLHGGPMQRAGLPDLLILGVGQLYAVEVKRPGGQATGLQLRELAELGAAGAVAIVATTRDEALGPLEARLKCFGRFHQRKERRDER